MKDFATQARQEVIAGRRPTAEWTFRRLIEKGWAETDAAAFTQWHHIPDGRSTFGGILAYCAVVAAAIALLIVSVPALATELRIEHTSKISKVTRLRTGEVESWATCVRSVYRIRRNSVGRVRAWCDGKRV